VSCSVSLDLTLEFDGQVFGHIDACVCVSSLESFMEDNLFVREAVKKFGFQAVEEYLLAQVSSTF
jgi:hypothetical protein